MTFHDWINNIRWKYFTNNKSGLIFKELMKEFQMVDKMTENKRYIVKGSDDFFLHIEDTTFTEDKHEGSIYNIYQVVRRLNEQEETIQSLKKELFESEKDYIMETYSDNPIRRDEKIQSLKEEFKARFGDVE